MSNSSEESYILFSKDNKPSAQNCSFTITDKSIDAYGYWAGFVSDMVASGAAPFIRINISGIRVTYHFTVFSLAPFNVVMDDDKVGLMALDDSLLAFGKLLGQWMYNWPWVACSILKSQDIDNPITKLILLSVVPSVDIIVDVPTTLLDMMRQNLLKQDSVEQKETVLGFAGD